MLILLFLADGIRLDDHNFEQFTTSIVSHAGPYALLGAVGLLGGIQRSSVSLVVIIVEGTGKVDYLLPIIFTTV
jgi:H+/Cl- antiporter ClcA